MTGWAQLAIETYVPWPEEQHTVQYEGREIQLRPMSADAYALVQVRLNPGESPHDGLRLLAQFLSSLSWMQSAGARILHRSTGGVPVSWGRSPPQGITGGFDSDLIPQGLNDKQRLALALYREGRSADSEFYAFLSFFKIINMMSADAKVQQDWIGRNLHRVTDPSATRRIQDLQHVSNDVAKYLYVSCRCAVSHAATTPIADPDDPEDVERIRSDLILMRCLAEVMIEAEFGVPSTNTIYREHLYELEGFRALLGPALVARIKAGDHVSAAEFPAFPHMTIAIRGESADRTLADLVVDVLHCGDGVVGLRCIRSDGACMVPLALDVRSERLRFDPLGLRVREDATSQAPLLQAAGLRIWRELLHNCAIEVRAADTGQRLGRTDGYLPMNMDVRATLAGVDGNLAALEAEALRRDMVKGGPSPGLVVGALLDLAETIHPGELFSAVVPEAATFSATDPFAFLVAACLDRGAVSEVIWTVPYDLRAALGGLSPALLASMRVGDLATVLHTLPRKPRYIHDAPRTLIELAQMVVNDFGGVATRLWEGRRAWEVRDTLERIHGVGRGIADMTVLLIERAFGLRFLDVDRPGMDIKGDVHTARVLFRLGLSASETPADAVATARRIRPTCPGELDAPLWIVGRRWCRPTRPACAECCLAALCPRRGVAT